MTPQDRAALMKSLMEHEGWKEYERSMREYIFNMTGAMDSQVLMGVKYAIQIPKQIILSATEVERLTR